MVKVLFFEGANLWIIIKINGVQAADFWESFN
jgi:hypothetical protein